MKHLNSYIWLVQLLALSVVSAKGYRILCLFPFNSKSHFAMFGAFCKGLARHGHQVDVISHFPAQKPTANYTDIIDLHGTLAAIMNNVTIEHGKTIQSSVIYHITNTYGYNLCHLMGREKFRRFIHDTPKGRYDLVVTEYFGASCYLGFGHLLRAPVVVLSSSMDGPYLQEVMGNPLSSAFVPSAFLENPVLSSFWDRLRNAIQNCVQSHQYFFYVARQTEIMRKYLGQDVPDIAEVERSVSLALINTHHSFHGIRPTTPALVEVGGIHVEMDEAKLTPELAQWLDEAKDGVVYFSLGSMLNIATLPERTIRSLYASFAKIAPVRVLMKIANSSQLPAGLPENVVTKPWIPQLPVLRHNKTRAFATHGGLMSSLEALHSGVPVIGLPIFADQFRNVNLFVLKNMGVKVNIETLDEKIMDAALNAVLNDPEYRKAAKRASTMFRDRPMSAMATAIYSIEYVVRNGPDALKSPAVDMPWWQKDLLDVYAFLVLCLLAACLLLLFLLKLLLRATRCIRRKETSRRRREKKKD
ncbi:hypothetical protein KM043_008893 [Ampulex compressa]|nr:hypothetical protein KM043_008893 [Ampulex compressa]